MQRLFALLSCVLLMGGCKSGPSRWDEKPSSSRTGEGDIIGWKTTPRDDGLADILLTVDGTPYLIEERASHFAKMSPGEYEGKGVPAEAVAAAYVWAAGAGEEDAQKLYAIKAGPQITVYSGYAAPGADHGTQWAVKQTIPL